MEVPESKNGSSTIEKPGVAHIASSSSSDVKIDRYVEQVESPDLAQDKERGSNHVNEGEPPVSAIYLYVTGSAFSVAGVDCAP